MPSLKDVAHYVRSKNAGPFWVTVDIFCADAIAFDRVRKAPSLAGDAIARLYGVKRDEIRRFEVASLNVVKLSFPRSVAQGSVRDADSHAGQYFVPLLDLPID